MLAFYRALRVKELVLAGARQNEITEIDELGAAVEHPASTTSQKCLVHEGKALRVARPSLREDAVDALLGGNRVLAVEVDGHAIKAITDCVVEDDRLLHADQHTAVLTTPQVAQ